MTGAETKKEKMSRKTVSILSPLRYPGAKRRLARYIAEVLRLNNLEPTLYVEPFAGGASVALQLLNDGAVEGIALGEKDPLLASFWKAVFNDEEWLISRIKSIEITLEKWDYFRNNDFSSDRERALACLFLNRTSFSGILSDTAGPIGGRSQTSDYPIDCRFPKETLIKRIRQAAGLKDKVVFVDEADWADTLTKVEQMGYDAEDLFYYCDPPFYHKAERLYRYCFSDEQHRALHDTLIALKQPWVLSYDVADEVISLYSDNGSAPERVELLYSASGNGELVEAKELIISNLGILPEETRLWRSSRERHGPAPSPDNDDA